MHSLKRRSRLTRTDLELDIRANIKHICDLSTFVAEYRICTGLIETSIGLQLHNTIVLLAVLDYAGAELDVADHIGSTSLSRDVEGVQWHCSSRLDAVNCGSERSAGYHNRFDLQRW